MKHGYISRPTGLLTMIFLTVALAGVVGTSQAQYLWMDTNGDGVFTAADRMNTNGTPTPVDVWINTAHNKDGSLATCDTNDGDLATWNSYAVNINVINGTATFENASNQQAAFTINCAGLDIFFVTNNSTEMGACAATGTPTPNGGVNLKMFSMTVTGVSGTPSLSFVPLNSQDQNNTSFGTACFGLDSDNTYKLGTDFMDADPLPSVAGTAVTETTWGKIKALYR